MPTEPNDQPRTADPEYTIGSMRVQTIRGCEYFYVEARTTMAELHATIDQGMAKLVAAQREGKIAPTGPVVFVYVGDDEQAPFRLEMGFPVEDGTKPVGAAQVRRLEVFHCGSLLYCGALQHLGKAYGALAESMKAAGLQGGPEMREWYLYFEADDSPNNVTLIQHGLKPRD